MCCTCRTRWYLYWSRAKQRQAVILVRESICWNKWFTYRCRFQFLGHNVRCRLARTFRPTRSLWCLLFFEFALLFEHPLRIPPWVHIRCELFSLSIYLAQEEYRKPQTYFFVKRVFHTWISLSPRCGYVALTSQVNPDRTSEILYGLMCRQWRIWSKK